MQNTVGNVQYLYRTLSLCNCCQFCYFITFHNEPNMTGWTWQLGWASQTGSRIILLLLMRGGKIKKKVESGHENRLNAGRIWCLQSDLPWKIILTLFSDVVSWFTPITHSLDSAWLTVKLISISVLHHPQISEIDVIRGLYPYYFTVQCVSVQTHRSVVYFLVIKYLVYCNTLIPLRMNFSVTGAFGCQTMWDWFYWYSASEPN